MSNSELPTRVSVDAVPLSLRLLDAEVGQTLRVVGLDDACRPILAPEGIDTEVELSIERRLALGGPLIVRLGRARLAIARNIAAGIAVAVVSEEPPC